MAHLLSEHDDDRDHRHGRRKRKKKLIPIGQVVVDCTPVFFGALGPALTVLSCPFTQVVSGACATTLEVQMPVTLDCVLTTPTVICPNALIPEW